MRQRIPLKVLYTHVQRAFYYYSHQKEQDQRGNVDTSVGLLEIGAAFWKEMMGVLDFGENETPTMRPWT